MQIAEYHVDNIELQENQAKWLNEEAEENQYPV